MRLIDADALIETLGVSDEDIVFKEILEDAPTIDAVPRWIPCEEKLPDDGEDVLISYRYKVGEGDTSHVYIALTSYGRIWSDSIFGDRKDWRQPFQFFYSNYEVIAWMPLPEPYRV